MDSKNKHSQGKIVLERKIDSLENYLDFAFSLSRKCGSIMSRSFRKTHDIRYKGPVDIVTEVDMACQEQAISSIQKAYPEHSILAEEAGGDVALPEGKSGHHYKWIIDPLDGTTNYAHGLPIFCFSIALEIDSEIMVGCAYNPALGETFYSMKGKGVYFNDKKIRVSANPVLERSLLSTGFPYDKKVNPDNNFDHFRDVSLKVRGIRRLGSAVIDLCYTAAGILDGYWELNLNPWDMAVGSLMVPEAGGVVSDFCNNKLNIYNRRILATNGLIHENMSGILCG